MPTRPPIQSPKPAADKAGSGLSRSLGRGSTAAGDQPLASRRLESLEAGSRRVGPRGKLDAFLAKSAGSTEDLFVSKPDLIASLKNISARDRTQIAKAQEMLGPDPSRMGFIESIF